MIKPIKFLFFITFFSSLSFTDNLQNIHTETSVTFNLLCAKCHEGECSGRLSFDTGSKKAANHIKRYANDPDLSKSKITEFFTLLNYMKKECALWMPKNEKPRLENLSHFALPSYKGYFIPLGFLKPGHYRLIIKTKEKIHFGVEVISNTMDLLFSHEVCPDSKKNNLHFKIEKPTNTFLRIRSRNPLHIISLTVNTK